MRGASALQDALSDLRGERLRILVVWEPVLLSDVAPPTTGVLSRITDPRAIQFWDGSRQLSSLLVQTARRSWGGLPQVEGLKDDAILWDCVLIFPPGRKWENEPPAPSFVEGPVVQVVGRVRSNLLATGL